MINAARGILLSYGRELMLGGRDSRERVLIGYGEVMSLVQQWEQALAILWWRETRKQKSRPTGDFDTDRSQKEISRLEAAFLRTTAQAVREVVMPHLDAETAADLAPLMEERNRLAHRFLRNKRWITVHSSLERRTSFSLWEAGSSPLTKPSSTS